MNLIYKYKSLIIRILLICTVTLNVEAQSLDNLEQKHGFQDIILDSEISSYPNFTYKKSIKNKKSEVPIHIYIPSRSSYRKIGDVTIKDLEVKSFLGKIIEIKIITEKDTDIMKALKMLYGEPSFSVRTNAWEWRSEGVLLSLRSTGKKKIEIIYTSRKLNTYIRENKEDSIEDISTDF